MSALPRHVALVSQSTAVPQSEISAVAAALNKQASRDFGPLWEITATVDALATLQDVPVDYWPIIVLDKLSDPTAGGYHQTSKGDPYSVVLASEFPLAASHECLEMLADPFGRRKVAGSPPPNAPDPVNGFSRVNYLVEVCDPCEDEQFSYRINGIEVSDFITPHYYDPVTTASVRYSFTGAITKPHEVLEGGYVSFADPATGNWWQIFVQDRKMIAKDISAKEFRSISIREATDDAARKFRESYGAKKKPSRAALAIAPGSERAAEIEHAIRRV